MSANAPRPDIIGAIDKVHDLQAALFILDVMASSKIIEGRTRDVLSQLSIYLGTLTGEVLTLLEDLPGGEPEPAK